MITYLYTHALDQDNDTCGKEQEIRHSLKDKVELCPVCTQPVKRLIAGGTGMQLLGGGWAKDGYSFTSHPRFSGQNGNKA